LSHDRPPPLTPTAAMTRATKTPYQSVLVSKALKAATSAATLPMAPLREHVHVANPGWKKGHRPLARRQAFYTSWAKRGVHLALCTPSILRLQIDYCRGEHRKLGDASYESPVARSPVAGPYAFDL